MFSGFSWLRRRADVLNLRITRRVLGLASSKLGQKVHLQPPDPRVRIAAPAIVNFFKCFPKVIIKIFGKKTCSFSLIERVILSAGAMLIFSVSFQIDQMPEGEGYGIDTKYIH